MIFRMINKTLFQIIYSQRKQVRVCHSRSCYWWPDWISLATMTTSSNGIVFRVTGPLWGEFTGHRWFPLKKPVTRSFDVFFEMRLNKRWSKPSRRQWFETPSCLSWRQCNGYGGQFGSRVWTKETHFSHNLSVQIVGWATSHDLNQLWTSTPTRIYASPSLNELRLV